MSDAHQEALERLRQEVAGLGVEELLVLCYSMHQRPELKLDRMRMYLDVLRRRGGERAQFASCLICFDLARQGDEVAQREFAYLADTMRTLALKEDLTKALVGDDPYLSYVWELCEASLVEMDPRFVDGEREQITAEAVATLDLLSDADLGDALGDFEVDDGAMWLRFDEAVEAFLGGEVGVPVYDPTAGFRLRNSGDVDRIERFLRELDSLRDFVPPARGFRALVLLFYGTHIRSKGLFGAINQKKQELLRAGVTEYFTSGQDVWEVAGALGPMHAEPEVWEKIADVVADFAGFCAGHPEALQQGPAAYDAVGRLIERDAARGNWRKSYGL